MIKIIKPLTFAVVSAALLAACQSQNKNSVPVNNSTVRAQQEGSSLVAVLQPGGTARLSDSIPLVFKVINPTKDTLQFTQYHTPFESIMSNFLTVLDEQGNEVLYLGPMTKRVMPPPANTYHHVAPGAENSVRFDLKKAYQIEKAGTYRIQYNSGSISGLSNGSPIEITVKD